MVPSQPCQMRSKVRGVVCGIAVSRGTIFWIDAERARWLIDQNAAEPVGAANLAGPSEIKDSPEKKSSAAVPPGPSTASASSAAPGKAAASSASPEAPASPGPTASVFRRRARKAKSA